MSRFVESLKRLYKAEKVTNAKLSKMKSNGKITDEEYAYIMG